MKNCNHLNQLVKIFTEILKPFPADDIIKKIQKKSKTEINVAIWSKKFPQISVQNTTINYVL